MSSKVAELFGFQRREENAAEREGDITLGVRLCYTWYRTMLKGRVWSRLKRGIESEQAYV